jgi:hypothetical protein
MLDLWKAAAPDIDILGSDTSSQPSSNYKVIGAKYARPDNPHWSPEAVRGMNGARNSFYALADFNAIGFGSFGVDGGAGTALGAQFTDLGANYRLFRGAMPAILDLQQKGGLQEAVEEEPIRSKHLIFDRYDVRVQFRPPSRFAPAPAAGAEASGRVLIGQLGPDEFLVLGFDSIVEFRPSQGSDFAAAQFLEADEGVWDDNGVWKRTDIGRTAQGDYAPPTVTLPAQGALFKVKLIRY